MRAAPAPASPPLSADEALHPAQSPSVAPVEPGAPGAAPQEPTHEPRGIAVTSSDGRLPAARRLLLADVEFRVFPYATVFLDGRKLGDTPLQPLKVSEGRHVVRLVNAEEHKAVSVSYVVKAGQRNVFRYELR